MSILYIEPFSGISGDMFLGALCGLTDSYKTIKKLPELLGLKDGKVEVNDVNKNGIVCKHVKVIDLGSGSDPPPHRSLKEIHSIIDRGSISDGSKTIAKEIFSIVGQAESRIHDVPLDKIHFHEVSGVDSILDIVGSAMMLDKLNVTKTYSDPVCTGYGTVKTRHGILPVPAPATAEILGGIPNYKGNEEGEKVTPTGAGILKYLNPDFNPPVIVSKRIAYGPGLKEFNNPNVVRISLVWDTVQNNNEQQLYIVETNIDDFSAEYLGNDFQDDLLKNGAKDFYFTSVQMKKGRPGLKISFLVYSENLDKVNRYILENTTTIGLRYYPVTRDILPRRSFEMKTKYGIVNVKEIIKPSGKKQYKIEYESLRELSIKNQISIQQLQLELHQLILTQSG